MAFNWRSRRAGFVSVPPMLGGMVTLLRVTARLTEAAAPEPAASGTLGLLADGLVVVLVLLVLRQSITQGNRLAGMPTKADYEKLDKRFTLHETTTATTHAHVEERMGRCEEDIGSLEERITKGLSDATSKSMALIIESEERLTRRIEQSEQDIKGLLRDRRSAS